MPADLRNSGFYGLMIEKRNDIYSLTGESSLGRLAEDNGQGFTPVLKSLGAARDRPLVFNGDPGVLADFVRPYLLRSNHPDEQMTLAALATMKPAKLDFNPRLFQYGGAYIYPLGAWLGALKAAGSITLTGDLVKYFENPGDMAKIFIAGRLFSLLFALASLLLVFLLALKHFGTRTAVLASLLFSIMPGIVFQAHIMKPYCLSMCFTLATLYYSLEIAGEPGRAANYFIAGLFTGLAAGSMPFYGLIITAPLTAFLTAKEKPLKNLVIFAGAAAAFFMLTNPYWFLDHKRLLAELHGFSSGKTSLQLPAFLFFLTRQIPEGTGAGFVIAAAAGIPAALLGRGKKGAILAVSIVIPVFLASLMFKSIEFSVQTVRLVLPWVAMSCVTAGIFLDRLFAERKTILFGCLFLAAVTFELFAHSYICAENFKIDSTSDSTRLLAGRWISNNVPRGARVAVYGLPEPFTVPPMDFRKYTISVLFKPDNFEVLDYFVCGVDNAKVVTRKELLVVADIKPVDSFLGLKYSLGSTSLNSEVIIYKIVK